MTNTLFHENRVDIYSLLRHQNFKAGVVTVLVCHRVGDDGENHGRKTYVVGASECEKRFGNGHFVLYTQVIPNGKQKNVGKTLYIDGIIRCKDGKPIKGEGRVNISEKRSVWQIVA